MGFKPRPTPTPDLRKTRAALDRAAALVAEQPAEALDALLDAWRVSRLPSIADAIDALSARIATRLEPIDDELEGEDFQRAWMEVAGRASALDVPLLVPGLLRAPLGRSLIARVQHLIARPPDPRIAAGLVAMIAEPPATANSNIGPMWDPLCDALAQLRDSRGRAALERRLAAAPPTPAVFWGKLYKLVAALLPAIPLAPASRPGIDQAIAAITSAIERSELRGPIARVEHTGETAAAPDHLLELIFAEPGKLENRLVYADYLLERGDPRGAAIQLDFARREGTATRADLKQLAELEERYKTAWAGPIREVIPHDDLRIELGFLAGCSAHFTGDEQRERLIDDPHWSTVKELHTDDVALLASPALRSLEHIGTIDAARLVALHRRVGTVGADVIAPLVLWTDRIEEIRALEQIPASAFPALRRVDILATRHWGEPKPAETWSPLSGPQRLPLLANVEELVINDQTYAIGDRDTAVALFDRLPALRTVCLPRVWVTFTLVREADGIALRAGFNRDPRNRPDRVVEEIGDAIARHHGFVHRVVVEHTGPRSKFTQKAYRIAAERFNYEVVPVEWPTAPTERPGYYEMSGLARRRLERWPAG